MFLENRIVNQEEMLERADQAQTNKSNFETTGGLSDDEVARQTQKKEEQKRELLKDFNSRVRSWLRTNAGGVLNTCKSNGVKGFGL